MLYFFAANHEITVPINYLCKLRYLYTLKPNFQMGVVKGNNGITVHHY